MYGGAKEPTNTRVMVSSLDIHIYPPLKMMNTTPLHEAAASGNLDLVKMLVARGANLNAIDDVRTGL